MMENINTILFDLDGTLTDSKEGIIKSIAFALEQMGHAVPDLEALAVFVGPPLRQTLKTLLSDSAEIERAITIYRRRYVTEGKGITENHVYPYIPKCLEALKTRGKRLYVATSKPRSIAKEVIRHFSLESFFEKIYGSEDDGTRSDKAELIGHLISCEKISSQNAVMIGDREHDIIGAKQNGMQSIGACWGYGNVKELQKAGATALAENPEALLDVLLP